MAFITGPVQIISDNIVSNVIYFTQDTLGNQCVSLEDYAQLQQPMILTFQQPQEQLNLQQPQLNTAITTTQVNHNNIRISPKRVITTDPLFYSITQDNQNLFDTILPNLDGKKIHNVSDNVSVPILDEVPDEGIHMFNDDDLTEVLNDLKEAGIEIAVENKGDKKGRGSGPGRPGRPRKDGQPPLKRAPTITCEQCEATFRGPVMMQKHMLKAHSVDAEKHKCVSCPMKFYYLNELVVHSAVHWEFGKCCPMYSDKDSDRNCPSSFSRRAVLRAHLQRKHCTPEDVEPPKYIPPVKKYPAADKEVRQNPCTFCSKSFDKPSQLERHLRCHTGEKPYICAHCGHSFTQKNSLVLHMIQHTNHKPFKCEHCPATFKQRGNCQTHMKRVHIPEEGAANRLKCPHCSCTFRHSRTLNVHIMRNHQNFAEDEIIDSTIADVMKGLASLSDQTRGCKNDLLQTAISYSGIIPKDEVHELPKVYRASLETGDSKNSRPSLFSIPAVKGSDGKLWYECQTCNYRFNTAKDLIRHIPTHSSLKKYLCEICNRRFLLSANLALHLKNGHRVRTKKVVVPKTKAVKLVLPPPKIRKKQKVDEETPAVPVADDNAVNLNNVFLSMPLIDTNDSDVMTKAVCNNDPDNPESNQIKIENSKVSNPIIGGNQIVNPVIGSNINDNSIIGGINNLNNSVTGKSSVSIDRSRPVFGVDLNGHSVIGESNSVLGRTVNPVMGDNRIVNPVVNRKYTIGDYVGNHVIENGSNIGDVVIDGSLLGLDSSQFSGIPENVLDGHSMGLDMGNILDSEDVLIQQPIRDMKNIKMNEAISTKLNQQQIEITALQNALSSKELHLEDDTALYDANEPTADLKPDFLTLDIDKSDFLTHIESNTSIPLQTKQILPEMKFELQLPELKDDFSSDNFDTNTFIDVALGSIKMQCPNDTLINDISIHNNYIGSKYMSNVDVMNAPVVCDSWSGNVETSKPIYVRHGDVVSGNMQINSINILQNDASLKTINCPKFTHCNNVIIRDNCMQNNGSSMSGVASKVVRNNYVINGQVNSRNATQNDTTSKLDIGSIVIPIDDVLNTQVNSHNVMRNNKSIVDLGSKVICNNNVITTQVTSNLTQSNATSKLGIGAKVVCFNDVKDSHNATQNNANSIFGIGSKIVCNNNVTNGQVNSHNAMQNNAPSMLVIGTKPRCSTNVITMQVNNRNSVQNNATPKTGVGSKVRCITNVINTQVNSRNSVQNNATSMLSNGIKVMRNNDVINTQVNSRNSMQNNSTSKAGVGSKVRCITNVINTQVNSRNSVQNNATSMLGNGLKAMRNNDVINTQVNNHNSVQNNTISKTSVSSKVRCITNVINTQVNSRNSVQNTATSSLRTGSKVMRNNDVINTQVNNRNSLQNTATSKAGVSSKVRCITNVINTQVNSRNSVQNNATSMLSNGIKVMRNNDIINTQVNSRNALQNNPISTLSIGSKAIRNTDAINNNSSIKANNFTQNDATSKANTELIMDSPGLICNNFQYLLNLPNGQIALLNSDSILNLVGNDIVLKPGNILNSQDSIPNKNNFNNCVKSKMAVVSNKSNRNNKNTQITAKVDDAGNDFYTGNYEVDFNGDLVLDLDILGNNNYDNLNGGDPNRKDTAVVEKNAVLPTSDEKDVVFYLQENTCAIGDDVGNKNLSGSTDVAVATATPDMEIKIPEPKKFFKTRKKKEPVSKHLLMGLEACMMSLKQNTIHKFPPLVNKCSKCTASFYRPSDLIRHSRTHTKERPFSCVQCGKCFSVKSTLTKHKLIHKNKSERKMYNCQVCGKSTTSAGSLAVHMKRHSDVRPHACPICELTFKTTGQRNTHVATHFKEKKLHRNTSETTWHTPVA